MARAKGNPTNKIFKQGVLLQTSSVSMSFVPRHDAIHSQYRSASSWCCVCRTDIDIDLGGLGHFEWEKVRRDKSAGVFRGIREHQSKMPLFGESTFVASLFVGRSVIRH